MPSDVLNGFLSTLIQFKYLDSWRGGGRNRLCTSVPNSFKKSFFITSVFLEVQSERKAELHNAVKHHDWVVCSVQFMPVTRERGTGTGRENPINV